MSIAADIDRFCERVEGREVNSELTLARYERWVRRFELWHPGADAVDEGTLRDFDSMLESEEFADYPWTNTRGPPTPDSYSYSSRTIAISALKHWCKHQYDTPIDTEPQNICKGEPEPFDPTVVDEDTIRNVIASGRDCNVGGCQAALQVSYDAILRGSELVRIRSEDVDLSAGSVYVRSTKGSDRRTISLDSRTVSALSDHINRFGSRDKLFHNTYGRPWTPSAWNAHVRRQHHDAGSHALFRHSPVCHRLAAGEDLGSVFHRARHKFLATTMKYASVVGIDVDTSGLPMDEL